MGHREPPRVCMDRGNPASTAPGWAEGGGGQETSSPIAWAAVAKEAHGAEELELLAASTGQKVPCHGSPCSPAAFCSFLSPLPCARCNECPELGPVGYLLQRDSNQGRDRPPDKANISGRPAAPGQPSRSWGRGQAGRRSLQAAEFGSDRLHRPCCHPGWKSPPGEGEAGPGPAPPPSTALEVARGCSPHGCCWQGQPVGPQ